MYYMIKGVPVGNDTKCSIAFILQCSENIVVMDYIKSIQRESLLTVSNNLYSKEDIESVMKFYNDCGTFINIIDEPMIINDARSNCNEEGCNEVVHDIDEDDPWTIFPEHLCFCL